MLVIFLSGNGKLVFPLKDYRGNQVSLDIIIKRENMLRSDGSRSLNSLDRMKIRTELVKHFIDYVCITHPQESTLWSTLLAIFHMLGSLPIWLRD